MSPVLFRHKSQAGFSLVEILVVLAIISILGGLAVTALNSVSNSQTFAAETSDFQQLLNDARSYAMANNTFVFVGIEEVDATQSPSAVPQVVATNSNGGRIGVAVIATKDGTASLNGGNEVLIAKLKTFANLHLQPGYYMGSGVTATDPSPLANRATLAGPQYGLGYGTSSYEQFTWPLTGTPQYTFNQIIQYGPDGAASLIGPVGTLLPTWLEIDLEQTHGSTLSSLPSYSTLNSALKGNQVAAIQIDGITGNTQVYRQ